MVGQSLPVRETGSIVMIIPAIAMLSLAIGSTLPMPSLKSDSNRYNGFSLVHLRMADRGVHV